MSKRVILIRLYISESFLTLFTVSRLKSKNQQGQDHSDIEDALNLINMGQEWTYDEDLLCSLASNM